MRVKASGLKIENEKSKTLSRAISKQTARHGMAHSGRRMETNLPLASCPLAICNCYCVDRSNIKDIKPRRTATGVNMVWYGRAREKKAESCLVFRISYWYIKHLSHYLIRSNKSIKVKIKLKIKIISRNDTFHIESNRIESNRMEMIDNLNNSNNSNNDNEMVIYSLHT